ncbi:hypothetical protein [Bombilactobacillus bombi]|nr:hypothetical protein [Bombilactobacillus bombi]
MAIRFTTAAELSELKKIAKDERESQYEDAICETESIICDYWQGDLTGKHVSNEISSLWAQFGKRGEHDKREDKQ